MIRINLKNLIDIDNFNQEDINRITELSIFYKKRVATRYHARCALNLYNYATDILKLKKSSFNNINEEKLFLSEFCLEDDKFLEVLDRYNLSSKQFEKLLLKLQELKKQNVKTCIIKSKDMQLLYKHYGLNSIEIIINKLYKTTFLSHELINQEKNQKTKKLY